MIETNFTFFYKILWKNNKNAQFFLKNKQILFLYYKESFLNISFFILFCLRSKTVKLNKYKWTLVTTRGIFFVDTIKSAAMDHTKNIQNMDNDRRCLVSSWDSWVSRIESDAYIPTIFEVWKLGKTVWSIFACKHEINGLIE